MATKVTTTSIQSVGRRKTASARVRLFTGTGENMVNDMEANKYFPGMVLEAVYMNPLKVVSGVENMYMTAKVSGGGIHAQAEAVAHGLARSLVKMNAEWKSGLRKFGLMTRDPRMKERRKAGLAHAARAKKSSPKR